MLRRALGGRAIHYTTTHTPTYLATRAEQLSSRAVAVHGCWHALVCPMHPISGAASACGSTPAAVRRPACRRGTLHPAPASSRLHSLPARPTTPCRYCWHPLTLSHPPACLLDCSHRGYYADIPFVSESVYHQVQLSEYA